MAPHGGSFERYDIDDPLLHRLIDIVYFANLLINQLGIGYSGHSISKETMKIFLGP